LHADAHATKSVFTMEFRNSGQAAAVFQVRSGVSVEAPRSYTVGAGKHLSDTWDLSPEFRLAVHGPNGFYRGYTGARQGGLDITVVYDVLRDEIALKLKNRGSKRTRVKVRNRYTSRVTTVTLAPGEVETERWSVARTRGWYDLVVTRSDDDRFEFRCSGHQENGRDSISDPMMGGLV
jgi:phospholipase C